MNLQSILNSITHNSLSYSNYILFGEEPFFIDYIESKFLNNIISEDEKTFNQQVFYGKDTNVFTLISTLKSYPMIGTRQLIVLRDAHRMDNISALEKYFQNPIPTSLFIICYKSKNLDKRKKWIKLFQKCGLLYESKKIYGQKISSWIYQSLADRNMAIEKSAEVLLLDALGSDLAKISNAINKLADIVNDGVINASHVQEHIGFHREYNNFELQNALAEKNTKKIFSIVNHFSANPNKFPLPPTIGVLFSFFSKLIMIHSFDNHSEKYIADKIKVHPFFVSVYKKGYRNYSFEDCQKIISYIKKCDLNFKGIKGSSNSPLTSLMLSILND